uniref:Uncharacterized protein n=1 Tax=Panagrolaimus sp. JU765 TaxID=591449 RepID=A0AC34QI96_9BILA
MGGFDLAAAYSGDLELVTSQIRETIRHAVNPNNHMTTLTSIKIDFANGQLLTAEDPRYVYRSPEVKIEVIPLKENDLPIEVDSEPDSGASPPLRFGAGADVYSPLLNVTSREDTFPKETAPFLKCEIRKLPSCVPNAVFHELIDAKSVAVVQEKTKPPPEHEVRYLNPDDILKWIEDGEKALSPTPLEVISPKKKNSAALLGPKSPRSPTSSLLSNSTAADRGIREKADSAASKSMSDKTLRSVASLTSVATTVGTETENGECFIVRAFSDGPVGCVEEEITPDGKMSKKIQCGGKFKP